MRNETFRKGLVCGIIVLLVGISLMPIAGSLSIERVSTASQIQNSNLGDDITPPVTTIYFDPPYPDGDNGWYVSDVTITLEATDDMSGLDVIKYLLDDSDWLTYTGPFTVESDGCHRITYYAIDKAGNVEQPSEVIRFGIDQTPPTIELTWDEENKRLVADVFDETSGVNRVEFYVDDEFVGEVTEAPYEWEYSGTVREIGVVVYDNAGNRAIRIHRSFRLFLEQFPRVMPVVDFTNAMATLDKSVFADIKIEDTSDCDCELGCELEIELTFGRYGITMIIKNIGDSDCTNVKWSITFDGGIILLGRETSGTILCIPPGENVTVSSGLIFGFGRTIITVSVESAGGSPVTKEQEAFIFLFFIII